MSARTSANQCQPVLTSANLPHQHEVWAMLSKNNISYEGVGAQVAMVNIHYTPYPLLNG